MLTLTLGLRGRQPPVKRGTVLTPSVPMSRTSENVTLGGYVGKKVELSVPDDVNVAARAVIESIVVLAAPARQVSSHATRP